MTILATSGKIHWNYFLALERDLEVLSRYVEFDERNLGVFSIELAHLLFAAASEVDVVAKLLCELVSPGSKPANINEYQNILVTALPEMVTTSVVISRYGLRFVPWDNWGNATPTSPDWWRSYNRVKHQRDGHFHEATLKNSLNALGALLVLTYHFYARKLAPLGSVLAPKDTTQQLEPASTLLRLDGDFYYFGIIA